MPKGIIWQSGKSGKNREQNVKWNDGYYNDNVVVVVVVVVVVAMFCTGIVRLLFLTSQENFPNVFAGNDLRTKREQFTVYVDCFQWTEIELYWFALRTVHTKILGQVRSICDRRIYKSLENLDLFHSGNIFELLLKNVGKSNFHSFVQFHSMEIFSVVWKYSRDNLEIFWK